MTTENNVATQADDETAALAKQLATWRAEVARLNDLIAHASGVQSGDEPMRAVLSVKPSEWSADTPLNAIIDGDAIAKSVRIMCLIDNYTEAMDSPINQHARDARTAIRCALMAEFEAAQVSPRATADVERDAARYKFMRNEATGNFLRFCPYGTPDEIDKAIEAAIATTKPGA